MRTTTKSLAVTASLLLVLVLSSAAAGATRNATPEKWVNVFCSSVVTWEKTVKTNTTKLNQTLANLKASGKVDIPTAKQKLVGFLSKVVHSTDTMVKQIKAVGAPSVKNGSKIQSGVVSVFTQLGKAFQDAKISATQLPTKNAKAFSNQALALAKTIQSNANRIGVAFRALDKYSTKRLNDAAKKDPACQNLGG